MALKGVKVIEIAGLAPAPFCGLILADFGADVIRVERPHQPPFDVLRRGKRSMALDLKKDEGKDVFKRLCTSADVLIEPFRAGVMERLGLGPSILHDINRRLIYARLSGFGQMGSLASRAGHDINYLAISGVLSRLGSPAKPNPPVNILGDFAGGGLLCAMGICMAIIERERSGEGQVIDSNIVEGAAYVSSWIFHSRKPTAPVSQLLWPRLNARGENTLDGGAPFYNIYKTKDGKFMSVGSLEPQFYSRFLRGLGLNATEFEQYDLKRWPEMTEQFAQTFLTKTLDEWTKIFVQLDACVEPVLDIDEAPQHPHNAERGSFLPDGTPRPSPVLSRTPAQPNLKECRDAEHTLQILQELGYTSTDISDLRERGVVEVENPTPNSKL